MTRKQRQRQEKRRRQRVFFSVLMILFTGIILIPIGANQSGKAPLVSSIIKAVNLSNVPKIAR